MDFNTGGAPHVSKFRKKYGLLWSKEMADPFIDLVLWQRFREPMYENANIPNNAPHELMMNACDKLFSKRQFVRHRWAERMIRAYTEESGAQYWLGAGSSGKSHMAGLCIVLDYITAFGSSVDEASSKESDGAIGMYGMMVSTSKDSLIKRSLASAIEYLGYLRAGAYGVPFKFLSQKFAIVPETVNNENVASVKAQIAGIPLAEGSEIEARGKVIGVHLPRIRVIADEFENLSGSRANAFQSAQVNLRAGCADYKCLYLSNPQGRTLPCSELAAPVGGWDAIDLDCYEWRNPQGQLVLRFDGLDSPGVEDPVKYAFLPTQVYIDEVCNDCGGEDSPGFWAFVRAYPPPDMGNKTVITKEMVDAWGMSKTVQWDLPPMSFASLDPAFTSDGDLCVMVRGYVGREKDTGRVVLCYDKDPYIITISAASKTPVLQQIGHAARDKMYEWGIPVSRLAVDDSGTQSVADYIEILCGRGVYRCNYSKKPPPLPMSVDASETLDKRYKNFVTWIYYLVHEYSQYGQIKGLPADAEKEFCNRQLDKKLKGLLTLETKKIYKLRNKDGRSPDTADACAMMAGMVRERFGLIPGSNSFSPGGVEEDDDIWGGTGMASLAREYNGIDSLGAPRRYT